MFLFGRRRRRRRRRRRVVRVIVLQWVCQLVVVQWDTLTVSDGYAPAAAPSLLLYLRKWSAAVRANTSSYKSIAARPSKETKSRISLAFFWADRQME